MRTATMPLWVSLWVILLAPAACGDGGTGESDVGRLVCEDHCACEGCGPGWIDDCASNAAADRTDAASKGCADEWDAFKTCQQANSVCQEGSFLLEGCAAEDTALRDCRMGDKSGRGK